MSNLSKSYDPHLVEEKWLSFWDEHSFFRADAHSKKEPFCIVIPPPNVTGVLHMGHALTNTLQDLLTRAKRMQGFEALWVPGTDHAGIATQTVVERRLFAETGKRRQEYGRDAFLDEVWQWKEISEKRILQQLKLLGSSCDWSRLRFTLDDQCSRAVVKMFHKLYSEGVIYRGFYLVNWDPVSQTALSDDEVEHEEREGFLWTIRYGDLLVSTTRPETLFADVAVAVHPDDERYHSYIGKEVSLPLTQRKIPVLADSFVDRQFGTGVVKITPGHDFNDYEVGQRHHLPQLNVLTPDGKLNELGGPFAGLPVAEARKKVVAALREEGVLVKEERHVSRVGVSYRSKAVIEPYLSKQWFVRMSAFRKPLLDAVREGKIDLVPPHWQATYEHWISNLRDWCISRQLWWGHRIPIWYRKDDREKMICYDGEGAPPDPAEWEQDSDVLDTWFSSALWPLSVLGWPDKTPELKKFYPTSVLVTGHDILFFWVARMILMGEFAMKEVPFHKVFLHGLIYGKSYWRIDARGAIAYVSPEEKKKFDLGETLPAGVESKWEKMSKSKGNVIDPLEIIQEYGADALRIALCSSVTYARQIDLDRRRFEEYKNFINKVWNGARFVMMNCEGVDFNEGLNHQLLTLEDRWILSLLNRTIREFTRYLDEYAFDRVATLAYEFYWNEFCARYVELVKPTLFGKVGTTQERENKQKLLIHVLYTAIRLLHPITPFITEEIFEHLKKLAPHLALPCLSVAPFPVADPAFDSPEIETSFETLFQIAHEIRKIRAEMQLPPSEKTELFLLSSDPFLRKHQAILLALTPTSALHFIETEAEFPSFGSHALVAGTKLLVPIPESFRNRENQRLEKEREKVEKQLQGLKLQLENPDFRAKAPAQLVENLERNYAQLQQKLLSLTSHP